MSHQDSYLHAIVEFNNGLIKFLVHETDMKIPIFNSIYNLNEKTFFVKDLDINKINNLNLKKVDIKKFPVVKILDNLSDNHSLFETVLVTANDQLVKMFLNNRIKFLDISKYLLKIINSNEFKKYKRITPRNVAQIEQLSNYVSLKISSLSI